MLRRLAEWTRGGIRRRLFLSQLALVLIPLLAMGALGYIYISTSIYGKVFTLMRQNGDQASSAIDMLFQNASRLTEQPLLDDTMARILASDYDEVPEAYRLYRKLTDRRVVESAIYKGIFYGNTFIRSVELVAKNTGFLYCTGVMAKGTVSTYAQIAQEPWFAGITESRGAALILDLHEDHYLSGWSISVGRNILLNPYGADSLGIIKINLNPESLRAVLEGARWQPEGIVCLTDTRNQLVLSTEKDAPEGLSKALAGGGEEGVVTLGGRAYQRYSVVSPSTKWRVTTFVPRHALFQEAWQLTWLMALILAGLLILLGFASFGMAKGITRPVLDLKRKLEAMKDGDLSVRAATGGTDEVGALAASFNTMADRLRYNMEEIYRKEEEKRRAEMAAMQAQINPHFLYNTLGAIRWMADAQGADSVAQALDQLVELFRSLTRIQEDLIPVWQDLEAIRLYASILQLRYMDAFTVDYDVDDALLECLTIRFLLQPMLENAIFHGLEDRMDGGFIRISVAREDDRLVCSVYDNGKGMDEATMARVLSQNERRRRGINNIGLYNVQERIKLIFGEPYGLRVESEIGKYTLVKAVLPLVPGRGASRENPDRG